MKYDSLQWQSSCLDYHKTFLFAASRLSGNSKYTGDGPVYSFNKSHLPSDNWTTMFEIPIIFGHNVWNPKEDYFEGFASV